MAALDTGPYPTAPGRLFGVAGADQRDQSVLESHRLAEFTTGPWQVDQEIRDLPGDLSLGMIGPASTPKMLQDNDVLPAPAPDIAARHSLITAFSSMRATAAEVSQPRSLQNVVMLFPDAAAAAAAAAEMTAHARPSDEDLAPGRPTPLPNSPEVTATTYETPAGGERVDVFTGHGPYVFFNSARTDAAFLGADAVTLVDAAVLHQKRGIERFVPTPTDDLANLPVDPTGQLLARTLTAPDDRMPYMAGVWPTKGWLHFELNPVAAAALFDTAGVDAVAQRLTTVYQAANPQGAERVADYLAEETGGIGSVRPVDGVPGLDAARCFERTSGSLPATAPMTWQRVSWRFKCVSSVDRYAFTAFSADGTDVRQQMAAQYRILAGR